MPDRLTVGVIGQTMRRANCQAHFTLPGNTPAVILTDDPGAFADWNLPPGVEIAPIDDGILTRQRKLQGRLRRRATEWLRGGSVVGARAEQAIRRLRPAPDNGISGGIIGSEAPLRGGLASQLQSLHEGSGVLQIVVFDVCDLPTVIDFSHRAGVPVVIR